MALIWRRASRSRGRCRASLALIRASSVSAQLRALDLDAHAGLFDLREVAAAQDFAETIELAEVRIEIQVLEIARVRGSQFQRLAARRHAVDGMQIGQAPLQSRQIRHGEIATETDSSVV
jgi:hypothetical protein